MDDERRYINIHIITVYQQVNLKIKMKCDTCPCHTSWY